MATAIRHVTIDCADPYELARFWAQVFEVDLDPEDEPGDPEALVTPAGEAVPGLLFVRVHEPRSVKNRIHLDLQPSRPRDEEVERILSLGANLLRDQRRADGTGWAVLTDPEGNEFCVERSAAERAS